MRHHSSCCYLEQWKSWQRVTGTKRAFLILSPADSTYCNSGGQDRDLLVFFVFFFSPEGNANIISSLLPFKSVFSNIYMFNNLLSHTINKMDSKIQNKLLKGLWNLHFLLRFCHFYGDFGETS